jgi:hypothetical protein
MFTATLIYAGLLPFAASATIAFALGRTRVSQPAIWACGIACGFVAGLVGLKSQAGFAAALKSIARPHEAADWLPIVVLLALGVSFLLLSAPPSRWRHALALATVLAIAVPLRLLSGNVRLTHDQWSPLDKFAYLTLLAATLGLVWLLLASGSDEQPSLARLLFLVIVAVGAAVVLALSGVFVYGQYSGALAAALTGTALACSLGATGSTRLSSPKSASASQRFALPGLSGAAAVITYSLGSLIILGHFFASLGPTNAVLLFISLAAAGTPLPTALLGRSLWQQLATRAVFCLTPLAIAIYSVID